MRFKIREARMKAGMTQTELAEKSGVSRSIISQLENGKRDITSTKTLVKIASTLGVDIGDIFLVNIVQ